ncbi:hypothetical protein J7E62_02495 [Variovorax paradoxus]|nr:hypothetical protein [Variovorax paradoxus]
MKLTRLLRHAMVCISAVLGVEVHAQPAQQEPASTNSAVSIVPLLSVAEVKAKYPIVIDLRNDGIELLRPEDSSVFADVNADGWRERIGWAAPGDAVLVFDADQDARVDLESEVSFVGYLPGARTDLEGLVAFDTDGDRRLSAADAGWSRFGLFQDRNANGRQDEGEYQTLQAAGIAQIGLQREGSPAMNNGNVIFGTSEVQWADGRSSRAADVMFAGQNVALPEAVLQALGMSQQQVDDTARIARMALLFNQVLNTADAEAEPPLAFVPAETDATAYAQIIALSSDPGQT